MNTIKPSIHPSWAEALKTEFEQDYFLKLKEFLVKEKAEHVIFPKGAEIFKAFDLTPFDQVKVVILGQDPYHNFGQAHGLCFSVPDGIQYPKSLINIFKELQDDLGIPVPKSGNLEPWAKQGVLLLNATLTVRAHQAGSHQNQGWERFTDAAIQKLSEQKQGLVFLLWGRFAQNKIPLINLEKHIVLKAAHPSPLSAYQGFFGCKHFSQTNSVLKTLSKEEINWNLER